MIKSASGSNAAIARLRLEGRFDLPQDRPAPRVVITGLGILAPNGHGLSSFECALREGRSGITARPELADLKFGCRVAGVPDSITKLSQQYFNAVTQLGMDRSAILGGIAAIDCWRDAGLASGRDFPDWDTSIIFGTAFGSLETANHVLFPLMTAGKIRRMGAMMPERIMHSHIAAKLAGLLGIGGQVTANSSADATSTESICMGYWAIREGRAQRVLVGGAEADSAYVWAGFDSMRALSRTFNHEPQRASRPLSTTARGFVPAAGAGALLLEDLDSALARGARIYAEIIGAAATSGGQRNGGNMKESNPEGARRCIRRAIQSAGITPGEIDLISGHFPGHAGDRAEARNWRCVFGLPSGAFPLINAPKSLFGHGFGASGAMESVACVLQIYKNFVHPSVNCEDLHAELSWAEPFIPRTCIERPVKTIAKASFGLGDVNVCLVFRRFVP